MKLPNNYYSSQMNSLGIQDTKDFKYAHGFNAVSMRLTNYRGKTNHMRLDIQCLRDINKALQAMEKRTRG
jgi:hypothetical protein